MFQMENCNNYIDRYDWAVLKNDFEVEINKVKDKVVHIEEIFKMCNVDEHNIKIQDLEEQSIDNAVNLEVMKKEIDNEIKRLDKMIQGGIENLRKKQQEKNEAFHINLMLLQDDIEKYNKKFTILGITSLTLFSLTAFFIVFL